MEKCIMCDTPYDEEGSSEEGYCPSCWDYVRYGDDGSDNLCDIRDEI